MHAEAILFLFAVVLVAVLLFTMVYYIIMFSDLECDYVNPIELCNKLNGLVIPEVIGHGFLTLLFLVNFSLVAFVINVPLLAYHTNKVMTNRHMFDATEIFRSLGEHKKVSFIKLAFYLVCFFYYLYRMIYALIADK